MLQAFLHSKRKLEYVKEANPFVEDTLTSSVFGLLRYLPDSLLAAVWANVFRQIEEDVSLGAMSECAFWPRWNLPANGSWCEPDVFFRFDAADVIVEAKRSDAESLQKVSQWETQLTAYQAQKGDSAAPPLFFMAIGGLGGEATNVWREKAAPLEQPFLCRFVFLSWSEFWIQCIEPVVADSKAAGHVSHLYSDLLSSFRLFNIATLLPPPLKSFPGCISLPLLQPAETVQRLHETFALSAEDTFPPMSSLGAAINRFRLATLPDGVFKWLKK